MKMDKIAESVQAQDVLNAGTSQWRNDNARSND